MSTLQYQRWEIHLYHYKLPAETLVVNIIDSSEVWLESIDMMYQAQLCLDLINNMNQPKQLVAAEIWSSFIFIRDVMFDVR